MKKLGSISSKTTLYLALMALAPSTIAAVGGLTYGYVNWPSGASYYNMDQRLRIDTAPLANSNQGYFWSYQFAAGEMTGYFGLQQQPNNTRTLVAAIWNTSGAVANTGFNASSFGGEGTGMHITGPYSWIPGRTYRLRILELSTDWWGFWVEDTVTGIDTYVGEIQNQYAPGQRLNNSVTFTEQFTGPNTCTGATAVRSTWFTPTANYRTVTASSVIGVVSDSAAVTACGSQVVSATDQVNNKTVNEQIVCSSGATANLLGVPSCWRYGQYNQSCTTVCSQNGIDKVYWPTGQNLSLSQCSALESAFGNTPPVHNASWSNSGAGCMSNNAKGTQLLYNIVNPSWNANFMSSLTRRFCGCAG